MVRQSLGNSGRFLNTQWHEVRRRARENTFSIESWGQQDRVAYDLDTVDFDRKQKDSSFVTDPPQQSEGTPKRGIDIRETDPVRD